MAKYMILPLPPEDSIPLPLQEGQRLTLGYPERGSTPEVGDQLLVFHTKKILHIQKQVLLPYTFEIDSVNRSSHTLVLRTDRAYMTAVPMAGLSSVLSSLPEESLTRISQANFQALTELMRGLRLQEIEVLAKIENYIESQGYYFDKETISNYHISLKTRPLVILAGLSGTGKSKLSQLYAEALGLPRTH